MSDLRIVEGGPERIPDLKPLWRALWCVLLPRGRNETLVLVTMLAIAVGQ